MLVVVGSWNLVAERKLMETYFPLISSGGQAEGMPLPTNVRHPCLPTSHRCERRCRSLPSPLNIRLQGTVTQHDFEYVKGPGIKGNPYPGESHQVHLALTQRWTATFLPAKRSQAA